MASHPSKNQCICQRRGNQVIYCCGETCREQIEQISSRFVDDTSGVQCSCCNNVTPNDSNRQNAGHNQVSQDKKEMSLQQTMEVDGIGLANSALEIIKVVDEMLDQATSLKKRLMEMVTQFQTRVCICAEKHCRCLAQVCNGTDKCVCPLDEPSTRARAGGGPVPEIPLNPAQEGQECSEYQMSINEDQISSSEHQQSPRDTSHSQQDEPYPQPNQEHDQSYLSQNTTSEYVSTSKSNRQKHHRQKAQNDSDNPRIQQASTSGPRPRGGATKEDVVKCHQRTDRSKTANKASLSVEPPAASDVPSNSSVGMARSTAEMDLRATLPLPNKQMKSLSPDAHSRSRGGQEIPQLPRRQYGSVRVGEIARRLINIQQEIQKLRDEVSKLSCESVCPKNNAISSSENILQEIMSSNLIGKAEEIKLTLGEIKADCYNKLTPSSELLPKPGEKRIREKVEREIKRNKPGFSRTINQVKMTAGAKIREENMHHTQFDQTYETNIDTQQKDDPNPTSMVFKVSKKTDETIRNPHAEDESRKTLKQLKKFIKTEDKAIDEEDTTKEQEQKTADKRIIATRRKVTRTEQVAGREALKEVLINVQINRTIDTKTGEIIETTQDLGNELSIETFPPLNLEKQMTSRVGPKLQAQASVKSTTQTVNPLFYNYSERRLLEDERSKAGTAAPSTMSTARTKPVSRISSKVASFFEIIPESEQQRTSEKIQRSLKEAQSAVPSHKSWFQNQPSQAIREEMQSSTRYDDARIEHRDEGAIPIVQTSRMYAPETTYQSQIKVPKEKPLQSEESRFYDTRSIKTEARRETQPIEEEKLSQSVRKIYSRLDNQKSVYGAKDNEEDIKQDQLGRVSIMTRTQRSLYAPTTERQGERESKHYIMEDDLGEQLPDGVPGPKTYEVSSRYEQFDKNISAPKEQKSTFGHDQQSNLFSQRSQLPSSKSKKAIDQTDDKIPHQSNIGIRSTATYGKKSIVGDKDYTLRAQSVGAKSTTSIGGTKENLDYISYRDTKSNVDQQSGITMIKSGIQPKQQSQRDETDDEKPLPTQSYFLLTKQKTDDARTSARSDFSVPRDQKSYFDEYQHRQTPSVKKKDEYESDVDDINKNYAGTDTSYGDDTDKHEVSKPRGTASYAIPASEKSKYDYQQYDVVDQKDYDLRSFDDGRSKWSTAPTLTVKSTKMEPVPYYPSASIQKSILDRHSDHDLSRRSVATIATVKSTTMDRGPQYPPAAIQKSTFEQHPDNTTSRKSIASKMDAHQKSIFEKPSDGDISRRSVKGTPSKPDNVPYYPSSNFEGPYFYKVQSELLLLTDSKIDRICAERARQRMLAGAAAAKQETQLKTGYQNNQSGSQPSSAEEIFYRNQLSQLNARSKNFPQERMTNNAPSVRSLYRSQSDVVIPAHSKLKTALDKTLVPADSHLFPSRATLARSYNQNVEQSPSKASSPEESYEVLLRQHLLSSQTPTRADIRKLSEASNIRQGSDYIQPSIRNRSHLDHKEDRLSGGSEGFKNVNQLPIKSIDIDCIPRVIHELSENRSPAEFFVSVIPETSPPETYRVNIVDKATGDILGFFFIAEKKFEIARNQGIFDKYMAIFVLNSTGAMTTNIDPSALTSVRRSCNCPCKMRSDSER